MIKRIKLWFGAIVMVVLFLVTIPTYLFTTTLVQEKATVETPNQFLVLFLVMTTSTLAMAFQASQILKTPEGLERWYGISLFTFSGAFCGLVCGLLFAWSLGILLGI